MNINLNQLRCFYLTARHGSVTKAAKDLFVTPPAITMQIKKLEKFLGMKLLIRQKNGFHITANGRLIYAQAEKIFKEVNTLERQVDRIIEQSHSEVSIGCHYIPGKYVMPKLISALQTIEPELHVKIVLGSVPQLVDQLKNQELQFFLTAAESLPQGLKLVPLFSDRIILVAAKSSKFLNKTTISIKDIESLPLMLPEKNTSISDIIYNYFQRCDISPQVTMDNISSDIVKNFINQDQGLGFLLRFTVKEELESGKFQEITITQGTPVVRFGLAYAISPPPGSSTEKLIFDLRRRRLQSGIKKNLI